MLGMKKLVIAGAITSLIIFNLVRSKTDDDKQDHHQPDFITNAPATMPTPTVQHTEQNLQGTQLSKDLQNTKTVSSTHPELERYSHLTPQHMLYGFFKDETLLLSRTELILQLVEQGFLNVNEQLREGKNSQHYTPLFAAIAANPNGITSEELQRFIDLGATIPSNSTWRRKFSMMPIRDDEVIPMWINAAGIGPEDYERLFLNSALYSDGKLATYIHEQGNQDGYYKDRLREDGLDRFIKDVNSFDAEKDQERLELFQKDPRLNYLVSTEGLLVARGLRLKKIAFWKKYANLTPEEIVELDRTAVKLQKFTTALRAKYEQQLQETTIQ